MSKRNAIIRLRRDNDYNYAKIKDTFMIIFGFILFWWVLIFTFIIIGAFKFAVLSFKVFPSVIKDNTKTSFSLFMSNSFTNSSSSKTSILLSSKRALKK